MKANLTLNNGKIKVGYGVREDYPIQVSMTREVFAKIVMDKLKGRSHDCDVRDYNEQQWKQFDEKLRELRFEN